MRVGTLTWDVLPADPRRAEELARRCGIDPALAQVLLNRGVTQPAQARRFLSPGLSALDDPMKLPDMAEAVERIRRAIADKEPILVFGDSDVDGVTAAAIVYEALKSLAGSGTDHPRGDGACVRVRLSNRLEDGYGFPSALISRLSRAGIKLLILVDCGTNQAEEIRALSARGIDTIVLDHHVPTERVASPLALVNPHRSAEASGQELCSAGLAIKLAQALYPDDEDRLKGCLDLAALGTLADYAPLVGESRIIVATGLERIPTTRRPGLKRLCEGAALTQPTPEQILRRLVPRLNAAGRLGDPTPVWRLLVESSAPLADRLIEVLGHAHAKTKALHRQITAEAHEQASRVHLRDQYVMVVGRRGWHSGLMGPLAAQLVDRYDRPAIALALDERLGVGSGRSIAAFNLFEALRACQGMLLRYGGHSQACGLTLKRDKLEAFGERINRHAQSSLSRHQLLRRLSIDLELTLRDVTKRFVLSLEQLRPFGPGNPRPLILLRHVTLEADRAGDVWLRDGQVRARIRGRLAGLLSRDGRDAYDVVASPTCVEGNLVVSLADARCAFVTRPLLRQPAQT